MRRRWVRESIIGVAGLALLLKVGGLAVAFAEGGGNRLGAAVEDDLAARARSIQEQERAAALKAAVAAAAEKRAADRLRALAAERVALEAASAAVKKRDDERLESLARVYSSMRPKDAARILAGLDPVLQVEIASRMKERTTAAIMAAMDGATAAKLSEALSKRPAVTG